MEDNSPLCNLAIWNHPRPGSAERGEGKWEEWGEMKKGEEGTRRGLVCMLARFSNSARTLMVDWKASRWTDGWTMDGQFSIKVGIRIYPQRRTEVKCTKVEAGSAGKLKNRLLNGLCPNMTLRQIRFGPAKNWHPSHIQVSMPFSSALSPDPFAPSPPPPPP